MATWIPESASRNAPTTFGLGRTGVLAAIAREPVALAGLLMVVVYAAIALGVGFLPLRDPLQISSDRLAAPTAAFPFGTDALGRDLFSRVLIGARLSMQVAVFSVAAATVAGGGLGLLSAILLALGIVAALGPDPRNVIIAIAVVYTPIFMRVVRGPVLALKARDFIEAARAVGATRTRIIVRHIVPNLLSTLIVQVSLALSWAVLTEGALSFLGLSAQPPAPSWGVMLNEGRQYLEFATHLAIFPGLAIMVAVLGFNLPGDGLRDALDPQRR